MQGGAVSRVMAGRNAAKAHPQKGIACPDEPCESGQAVFATMTGPASSKTVTSL